MFLAETMNTGTLDLYCDGFEVFSFGGLKVKKKGRVSGGFVVLI